MKKLLVLGICLLWASTAMAGETVNFVNVPSEAASGTTTYNATLTGGYNMGLLDWAGFASTINAGTYASELQCDISGPLGAATLDLATGTTYSPGAAFSGSSNAFDNAGDPAGLWTFDFYESYDDGADGLADANWDYIDFTFNDYIPPQPPINLGTLTADTSVTGTLAAGQVVWYQFTIGPEAYLDITSNQSTGVTDSELGLYDNAGAFIVTDDDDGFGLLSTLTFGTGSGLLLGDSYNLNNGYADGEDGPLGPGTYFLAFGGYNTTFGTTMDDVSSTSTQSGAYQIDFYVPEPGTLALLAFGGLALLRRR